MKHKKRSAEEWRALIATQEASGQTQEEWCISNGVNLYTYRNRARHLRQIDAKEQPISTATPQKPTQQKATPDWLELKPPQPHSPVPKSPSYLIIEIGAIRITADINYPLNELSTLCLYLAKSC
jgi:hypothetical protein